MLSLEWGYMTSPVGLTRSVPMLTGTNWSLNRIQLIAAFGVVPGLDCPGVLSSMGDSRLVVALAPLRVAPVTAPCPPATTAEVPANAFRKELRTDETLNDPADAPVLCQTLFPMIEILSPA